MNLTPTLLVYDDAVETSEVLDAVFRPRGVQVERVSSRNSLPRDPSVPPLLTVVSSDFPGMAPAGHGQYRVVIGRFTDQSPSVRSEATPGTRQLPSLFHFQELVSAIDQLLNSRE